MKPLMTLEEAAEHTPYGVDFLRKAVHQTDPNGFPPPLAAKAGLNKSGTVRAYLVTATALPERADALPDA